MAFLYGSVCAQVPSSYVSLGSIALAGPGPPSFQVLAVAVNSGLVAFPIAFTRVWSPRGLSVWLPQAPPDYVALGYVAVRGDQAPPLTCVGCLHRHVVVPASMGQVCSAAACHWRLETDEMGLTGTACGGRDDRRAGLDDCAVL